MKTSIITTLLLAASISTTTYAEGWNGQGEAGLVVASGNTDTETLNIGLKFEKTGETWDHEIGFTAYQASSDGDDTAESFSANYTLKRNLSERSNIFFNFGYLDDEFDGFTEQLSASVGYGYKVINNDRTTWETGAGVGYRDTSELTIQDDSTELEGDDLSNATFVLRSDFSHQLTETTKFVDTFKAEIGSENTFVENDASLFVTISDRFSLKAGFIVRHNTDPAIGADETDTISSLSLVYGFRKKK